MTLAVPSVAALRTRVWLGRAAASPRPTRSRSRDTSAQADVSEPERSHLPVGSLGEARAGRVPGSGKGLPGASPPRSWPTLQRLPNVSFAPLECRASPPRRSSATPMPSCSRSPGAKHSSRSVSYRHRDAAVRLANAYAAQFTRFQAEINRNSLDPLLRWYQARIEALAARGQTGAAYRYRDLLATKHELERQARNAVVLEKAEGAAKVHPHALRNGLLGGALGALIGVVLTVGVAARRRRVS
jgi:hypothetical protein